MVPMGIFSALFIVFSLYINRILSRKADPFELRKGMLIALIAVLAAVMGQTIVKFAFNRPRFRTLTDPDRQYTYWFVHHPFALDSSFPSGHAAQSALSFLLLYLKRFIPKLRTRRWDLALGCAAAFITASTMLSRIFLGAHYATDVWAGCFLTLGTIFLADRAVENSYMLPEYRLRMIREHALRLCGRESDARILVEKIDAANLSAEKGELVLRLLEVYEETEALLAPGTLRGSSERELKRIRRLLHRFMKKIRLKNEPDLYAAPVK